MYAVVRTGGKQYRVEPGAVIDVERLKDVEEGAEITLDEVLLLAPDGDDPVVGQPLVAGASITATCVKQFRARKVIVWKYIPKERYRRKRGHRHYYTRLRIDNISVQE